MRAHPIVRAGLRAGLAGALAWAGACKGPPYVAPAIECADPCCGGNGNVDCEANPTVSCIQDADICSALEYGCSNGTEYSGVIPPTRPLSCSTDAGAGDALTVTLPDGFSSLVQGGDDAPSEDASPDSAPPDGSDSSASNDDASDSGASD